MSDRQTNAKTLQMFRDRQTARRQEMNDELATSLADAVNGAEVETQMPVDQAISFFKESGEHEER